MQRKPQSYGEQLKPVRLYIDDLEQIVEVLQEVATDVEISTDEYTLTDIGQLPELKREFFTFLELATREPYISVNLKPNGIWLYIAKDDMVSRGAFEKIKRILVKRKRPFAWLLHNSVMSGLFTGLALNLLGWGFIQGSSVGRVLGIFALILGVWWSWYGHKDHFTKYSLIIPKHRIDEPNFFKRNADDVVLAIIAALVGSLLTLVIAKLTGTTP